MTGTVSEIDWEIKQLEEAIVYYQEGIEDALTLDEIEKYRKTVVYFHQRINQLRKEKDGIS